MKHRTFSITNSSIRTIFPATLLAGLTLAHAPAMADGSDIGILEDGQGPALVFIPGLNSGKDSFTSTCEAFVRTHRCVLLQLPGFAGQPPVDIVRGFLETMKDDVIELLQDKQLSAITLVGHSLGGVLSMMISLEAPELVHKIVIIDSLPFSAAIQNPAITVDMATQQAEMMRDRMNSVSDSDFFKNAMMNMNGMSRSPARTEQLELWTQTSDRATTTAAMYDLMTADLRDSLADLKQPALVLGSWAAYKPYGSTLESTKAIFTAQYAAAPEVEVRMSEDGYHFLMWDDSEWVNAQISEFIGNE